MFELLRLDKFKVYASKNISIKQFFDVGNVNPGSYEANLSLEQLNDKKDQIMKHIQQRLRMSFVNFNKGNKDMSQAGTSSTTAPSRARSKSITVKSGSLDAADLPTEFKKLEDAQEAQEDAELLKENHGDELKDTDAENSFILEANMVEKADEGAITEQDLIE